MTRLLTYPYSGKLAAAQGRPQGAAIGRWLTDHDRSMFTVGYFRGHKESVADASAGSIRTTE